ncbi:DHHC palmitoyltransferase-domain-containing protein [Jimgerdemannia flammicorona]|uniref:Palmitoyltransferase n=1 Tax=Jimgerdemannia flammicorona TaxID=994334 RepID=A0A433DB19_9FUNG|nr:DHHC palmitoyltransferase-domain-containing protein [Jimgerdemannia flammicorona]
MVIHIVDRAIYGIGPLFIVLAVVLISLCATAYFAIVFPFNHPWTDETTFWQMLGAGATLLFSVYMICNIAFHYYMAVTTPPGGVLEPKKDVETDEASLREVLLELEEYDSFPKTCKKCHLPKPERAHHCSVCNTCVLKFDHHCPWIHNCVGHFNHRYFLLFMTYMVVAALYFVIVAWGPFLRSLDFLNEWPYWYPRALMAFSVVLAVAMGVALGGRIGEMTESLTLTFRSYFAPLSRTAALCGWHYYLIITGQTTVEFYNNQYEKGLLKSQGEFIVEKGEVWYMDSSGVRDTIRWAVENEDGHIKDGRERIAGCIVVSERVSYPHGSA